MQEHGPDGAADQGELFIGIAAAVIKAIPMSV